MLKNYFKTALRNIWKNKSTGFINLFGLSIGMTAAVFIFLWVQNEISFDNYHPGNKNIYRITNAIQVNKDEAWVWETSPMPMAEAAIKEIPEAEKATQVIVNTWGGMVFNINHKLFSEKTSAWIDKSWFNMFHYDFVTGNAAAFNQSPYTIVLTESKAKKYFGDANAVGQIIRVDTVNYTVQGVVKDNPVNSSFQFDIFLHMEGRLSNPRVLKNDQNWNNFGYTTFIQLKPGASQQLTEGKLNVIIDKNRTNHNVKISLMPLAAMYFDASLQSSNLPHGSKKTTYIFSILGLLLLVTACINYVNLTTAKASLRAKEVSVRKIIGAQRKHLFFQFIAESLTISVLALFVTIVLIKLCLPFFNDITETHFELPLTSASMWRVLLGTLLFATVLNGIYPAAMLSSFKPLNVFRGKSFLKLNDGAIRKGLVVFQFTLSMIFVIATIVIYKQLQYVQKTNPGYNVEQVMGVQIPYKSYRSLKEEEVKTFFSSFRQELLSQSSIAAVSSGGEEIVNVGSSSSGNADWDGHDTAYNPTIARLSVDADFQEMFKLQLTTGHWFKAGTKDDHNYILNETAVAAFNMHQPVLGQRFTMGGDTGQVIGVVKDFHYKSMHEKIGPIVLLDNQGSDSYFFVKAAPGNITKMVGAAGAVWSKFIPDQPFSYTFLDDSFNALYKADIKISRLVSIFCVIAIIICAMGLFGLAAFTAEQRTKEIGIRKVLGASVSGLVQLLSANFLKLVLIAFVVAVPVSWWAMNKWLQDFAYRTALSWWVFGITGVIALLIALMSVSFQAIRAAVANPVKSLRTE
ncbi:MAG: ABC transporter permease [Bacteroidota bacterium]